MPEHSSWLTLILSHFRETLDHNADMLGESIVGKQAPTWHSFEPLAASLFIVTLKKTPAMYFRIHFSRLFSASSTSSVLDWEKWSAL